MRCPQQLEIGSLERECERAVEQRAASSALNRSASARDLDELACGAQARDADRGPRARCDRDADARREMLEQERHAFVDLGLGDHVVVVEHQHEVRSRGGERVDERREHDLGRTRAGAASAIAEPRESRTPAWRSDARRCVQKRTGSLSAASRRARRTRVAPAAASHSVSSVDLPEPAGATSSVRRGGRRPRAACTSRTRGTCPARSPGGSIFVTSTAAAAIAGRV